MSCACITIEKKQKEKNATDDNKRKQETKECGENTKNKTIDLVGISNKTFPTTTTTTKHKKTKQIS